MNITIMTEPLSSYYRVRTVARKYIKHIPGNLGGHWSVTRSLFDGFKAMGYEDFNYRPADKDICNHVHVLSGINTLQYAIKLKKQGRIKRLTAGPNIAAYPDSVGHECLEDGSINRLLFPSQNNIEYFCNYMPGIREKSIPFASGVNEDVFCPTSGKREIVLIYSKRVDMYWGDYVSSILEKHGFQPVIIRYGSYNLKEYKKLLNKSMFMISLSKHDTQGLYLAEAWAMDCPTICYNSRFCSFPNSECAIEGDKLGSPYVCDQNGVTFDSISELEIILDKYKDGAFEWNPREWTLQNMTDKVCSQKFLELVFK